MTGILNSLNVQETEKREDLKVMLNRYDACLQKNRSSWVSVEKFHHLAVRFTCGNLMKATRDCACYTVDFKTSGGETCREGSSGNGKKQIGKGKRRRRTGSRHKSDVDINENQGRKESRTQ
jgi:hypothetical protein